MTNQSSPGCEHWLALANELEREHNIYLSQYGSYACKETRAKLEQRLWDDKQTFIQALRAGVAQSPAPVSAFAISELQAWREDVVKLRDLAIERGDRAIENQCFNVLMTRPLYPISSTTQRDPVLHDERFPSAAAVTSNNQRGSND